MEQPGRNRPSIVIAGGGTAGWMTAAAFARILGQHFHITVIESSQIGTVGVGEATIPHIRDFNEMLGVDEAEFVSATGATYKLGIRFEGWLNHGSVYHHPFGSYGLSQFPVNFAGAFAAANRISPLALDDVGVATQAMINRRFARPVPHLHDYSYAYHLDATRYAAFLKRYSLARGVEHIDAHISHVQIDSASGDISKLNLRDGGSIPADWVIDCTGFRALLIEGVYRSPFESWKHYLPCDRAVAMGSAPSSRPPPYTQAAAHKAGWQWQIPLQHRTGNGVVYASEFADGELGIELLSRLEGINTANPPRQLSFTAGLRRETWVGNCVAIGLSSGFLEPLESTSIYLIQLGIYKLLELISTKPNPHHRAAYNRAMTTEYEIIRDFLILHYRLNQRSGEPFWDYLRNMPIPASLQAKISAYELRAELPSYEIGLFKWPSWLAVFAGQGCQVRQIDPRLCGQTSQLATEMERLKHDCHQAALAMPPHHEMLPLPAARPITNLANHEHGQPRP